MSMVLKMFGPQTKYIKVHKCAMFWITILYKYIGNVYSCMYFTVYIVCIIIN